MLYSTFISICLNVLLPLEVFFEHLFLKSVLSYYYVLGNFTFFRFLISSFILLWLRKILHMISLLNLFCDLIRDLSWRIFHIHLRVIFILLLFGGVFVYVWYVHLVYSIFHVIWFLIDFLSEWIATVVEALKSTNIVLLSMSDFSSLNVCFTYLGIMVFNAHTFLILL